MRNLSLITVAAIAAIIGITITESAQAPAAQRAEILMPSILRMMADAGNLPSTPFVAP
jgi:hypothetical protein